jgi:hypothetical protein
MKRINEKEFMVKINTVDIVNDKENKGLSELDFKSVPGIERFWRIPDAARRLPYFINVILDSIDPWEELFIWKHMGSWDLEIHGEDTSDDLQALMYKGAGIDQSHADIIRFDKTEVINITAIIFNQLVFGWHVGDDIYIIPDHGRQIIKTSHHDVVYLNFKEEERLNQFIRKMAECGFTLPDKIPDGTFKKPDWMK